MPGNEACFEVLSTGSGVKSLKKGDWAIAKQTGLGTWRTHLQVEESKLLKVDKEGVTPTQVGTVAVNPVTAWRMLTDFVQLNAEKDWFVQNGANSGVGRAAVQLAKKWGIRNIAVIRSRPDGQEEMEQELLELGATKVVTQEKVMSREFSHEVKKWTEDGAKGSIRLGLNCVGGPLATAMARVLAPGAHMVTYGAMSRKPMEIPAGLLIFKNLVFDGFWVSKWSDMNPEEKERTVRQLLDMIRKGELKDVPTVEVKWEWGTKKEELVEAVQGTLEGFRKGKGSFIFGES